MAALSLFDYRFGSTLLHRMEGRSKFLAFIILTPTVFGARPEGLFLLSAGIVIPPAMSGLNPMRLLSGLRPLFLVLGFIWIARALFTPGEPLVSFFFGTVTREGVSEGALFCWRMLLVVLASVLYSATTRSAWRSSRRTSPRTTGSRWGDIRFDGSKMSPPWIESTLGTRKQTWEAMSPWCVRRCLPAW